MRASARCTVNSSGAKLGSGRLGARLRSVALWGEALYTQCVGPQRLSVNTATTFPPSTVVAVSGRRSHLHATRSKKKRYPPVPQVSSRNTKVHARTSSPLPKTTPCTLTQVVCVPSVDQAMTDQRLRRLVETGLRLVARTRTLSTCPSGVQSTCPMSASAAGASRCVFMQAESETLPGTSLPPHAATVGEKPTVGVRPFEEMPGPKGYPVVGTLLEYFRPENRGRMHEIQVSEYPDKHTCTGTYTPAHKIMFISFFNVYIIVYILYYCLHSHRTGTFRQLLITSSLSRDWSACLVCEN